MNLNNITEKDRVWFENFGREIHETYILALEANASPTSRHPQAYEYGKLLKEAKSELAKIEAALAA